MTPSILDKPVTHVVGLDFVTRGRKYALYGSNAPPNEMYELPLDKWIEMDKPPRIEIEVKPIYV